MVDDPMSGLPSADGEEWAYPTSPRQRAQYDALEAIAEQFGQWDQSSGPDGAHYVAESPFQADGLVCSSCLFYDGARSCEVVAGDIAPAGVCKLWIIPGDLVASEARARSADVDPIEIRRALPVDTLGREHKWFRTEVRALSAAEDGRPRMGGTAAVFSTRAKVRINVRGQEMTVLEQLAPTAFANTLQRQDIMLLWQHQPEVPLARTGAGNLELRTSDNGLEWLATPPDTTAARDARALVESGVVDRMSFGFTVPAGGDTLTWDEEAGMHVRTIHDLRLWEVSLVTWPAYDGTSASLRARHAALAAGQTRGDVAQTVDSDIMGSSATSPVVVPGAGTTSEDAKRAGTTAAAGVLDTRLWALRFAALGDD
jgi:HK97 family phage prohead protease